MKYQFCNLAKKGSLQTLTKADHNLCSACHTERMAIKTTGQTNGQQLLTMSSVTKGRQDKLSLPIILILAVYCSCIRKDKPV